MTNYRKRPYIEISEYEGIYTGWNSIIDKIENEITSLNKLNPIIAFELYHGVYKKSIIDKIKYSLSDVIIIDVDKFYLDKQSILSKTHHEITDDPIFGRLTKFTLNDFIDSDKAEYKLNNFGLDIDSPIILIGTGTTQFLQPDILVYFDMPRWEIIQRFRKNKISNLFINNSDASFEEQYKRGYFLDWRLCDKQKSTLFEKIDLIVGTVDHENPVMISGDTFRLSMNKTVDQPFELVPFFDPGPWGGQWMKKVCDLDRDESNFAWCFNCVPEENSLLYKYGEIYFEIPAMNLVLYKSEELLGEKVFNRFGAEFPIRFDFLDTMDGGNLSLQVHPTTEYIKEKFNIDYTQDESYYIMDAKPNAKVYLGLQENAQPEELIAELKNSQINTTEFDTEKYVNTWPAKKHDHFLIPSGTIHCSGKDCMVLEISSTPYIFTFKLWDWNRLGLNGKPRPINIEHGKNVIQVERKTEWVNDNLINKTESIVTNENYSEEKTGLHELQFIETIRHTFTETVNHKTNGNLNVLCLVDGEQIVVESPIGSFEPYIVNYAEVFIIPANINEYSIRPTSDTDKKHITIKAFVR